MHSETVKDLTEKGELLYNAMYGSTANNVQELLDKNLGSSMDDMFYINLLATSPNSQGKGYGSALVASVTSLVCLDFSCSYISKLDCFLAFAAG